MAQTITQATLKLSRDTVESWPGAIIASGMKVLAPILLNTGQSEYALLTSAAPKATGLGKGLPRLSPKPAWFPRSEPILNMERIGREWRMDDPDMQFPPVVIFGARPCDAAAPEILAPLFGWDFHDPFFEKRRKQIAFVVLACQKSVDAACFCTSVNGDPAGENVGDVTLTEAADGGFIAQANTEFGERLIAMLSTKAEPDQTDLHPLREKARQAVSRQFDPEKVRAALEQRFGDAMWERASRSCIACGTCAFACPTCHCFDIQDETVGNRGIRQKNWDACAFPNFTLHTSGHNPRPDQAGRWRQRLSHKFRYYPEKFGKTLCTGCGRCIRLCPAGMDLLADLKELAQTQPATIASAPADNADCACQIGAVPGIQASNPAKSPNIYRPYLMRVALVRDETPDVRTLRLEFTNPEEAAAFSYRVGQFGLYSAIGEGEATFCVASSPTRKGYIECTFRQAGRVTRALRRLNEGDLMGFRGPYGNSFPVENWKGKDLLFVAGGIALPPMRSVIQYCLDNRGDYGEITIVYGARSWSDHVYKDELAEWEKRPDVNLWLCIDWKMGDKGPVEAEADDGWRAINLKDPMATQLDAGHRRYTAFVPQLVEAAKPSPTNRVAVLCGPPIMIKFTMASLKKLGYASENVFTTLENRMKCGLGKCGRCNVGPVYVCKEGPVFTARQVEQLPPEM